MFTDDSFPRVHVLQLINKTNQTKKQDINVFIGQAAVKWTFFSSLHSGALPQSETEIRPLIPLFL